MPRTTWIFLLLGALVLGCASGEGRIPVSTAFDPLVQFPEQATFAWDREKISLPTDPQLDSLALAEAVEQASEAAFAAKGYRRTSGEQPDYQLSYHLRIDTFIAADRSSSTAELSLLLADRTGRRVWTGWGRAPFYVGATSEERSARLRQALDDMLVDCPPCHRPGT